MVSTEFRAACEQARAALGANGPKKRLGDAWIPLLVLPESSWPTGKLGQKFRALRRAVTSAEPGDGESPAEATIRTMTEKDARADRG